MPRFKPGHFYKGNDMSEFWCNIQTSDNDTWRDRYMREVEGLNNEGDPIGGDPPNGLVHQLARLRLENTELRGVLDNSAYLYMLGNTDPLRPRYDVCTSCMVIAKSEEEALRYAFDALRVNTRSTSWPIDEQYITIDVIARVLLDNDTMMGVLLTSTRDG